MKVVITGASGNVGTALIRRLVQEESVGDIVGICRRPHSWQPPRTRWVYADVAEDDLAPAFRGADVVVHLAWLFQPTHRPQVTWQSNVVGSQRVLDAVHRAGVPALVHASSVGTYSPRAGLDLVDESWPTWGAPTAAYSREKAMVERLLDTHEARHPERRVVRMRPAFIFRDGTAAQQRRLFLGPFVPRTALRRGLLPALPLPRGLHLQALHAEDVAEAYAAAVLRPVTGAFNLAGDVLDIGQLAGVLGSRALAVPASVVRAALAGGHAAHLVPASPGLFDLAMAVPMMRADRARAELSWEPRHDASAAVSAFLRGAEHAADGPTPPLARGTSGPARRHEVATGVGERP